MKNLSTPRDWQDRTLVSLRDSLNTRVSHNRATELSRPLVTRLTALGASDEEIVAAGIFIVLFGLQGKAPGSL